MNVPIVPGFEQAYREAWKLAVERLRELPDLKRTCEANGVALPSGNGNSALMLDYFAQPVRVNIPDGEITAIKGDVVPPRDRLVLLHYLANCNRTRPTGKTVTFQELADGMLYYPTFLNSFCICFNDL